MAMTSAAWNCEESRALRAAASSASASSSSSPDTNPSSPVANNNSHPVLPSISRIFTMGLGMVCLLFLLSSQTAHSLSMSNIFGARTAGSPLDDLFGRPRFLQAKDQGSNPLVTTNSTFPISDHETCARPTCDAVSKVGTGKLGREVTQREWCASVMRGCGFVMTHLCPAEIALASGQGGITNRLLVMLSSVTGSCQQCVDSLAQMGCKECGCVGYGQVEAAKNALNCCPP
mmetsp:Transcript_15323/g.33117  ORF Transcript_15323/g.33117 Transcript_15323/m.33117 type:complete len:231 (-) Transcript_15323:618-1310(-)